MNKSKCKSIIAVMISMSMVLAVGTHAFAVEDTGLESDGTEVIDEVVENVVEDEDFTEDEEESIAEDIEIMDELGLHIEDIERVEGEDEDFVYEMPVTDDLVDEISVEQDIDGTVTMNVTEGEIDNELVITPDGTVYLDGNEVIYEVEEVTLPDEELDDEISVVPSTGGITWYKPSKAPSNVKNAKYGSYSVSWRCSNVKLQTAIKNIAFNTIVGLLTPGLSGGIVGFTSSVYYELTQYNPKSKNISYIDYVAKAKKNPRFYKGRRYTYAKKNYKGKKITSYSYGIMM